MTDGNKVKNIAVFASGNGSNAENIIRYFLKHDSQAKVALVICNRPDAPVLKRASSLGVPAVVIRKDEICCPSILMPVIDRYEIDFIALAGFLLVIPDFLISRFKGRIVNIHPSLLPKFGGKGMYGRHVHEAVVASAETETGITIHHVSERYDEGSIIFQSKIAVSPEDTPDTVARKVNELEIAHYPHVISGLL